MITVLSWLQFYFLADPCYNYKSLSDADRKSNHQTPQYQEACDNSLPEGWYRFVGAAGTKMPTTRVPAYRCGTNWSGWLMTAHPTLEDGEVLRTVCFSDRSTGCKYSNEISVKNCGSHFIYEFFQPPGCDSRYCSTDWMHDMTKGDSQRKQETSCLVHLFSPFSQQLSLTVLSCGLYQLPTKACHNMKLVIWKYYEKSDGDTL